MNNLRSKILILAMALVVVTQVGTLATILFTANRDVSAQAQASLETGGSMFREVMRRRVDSLRNNVDILASDFAFKQAVATQERGTITSVLRNHGQRINADIAFLLDFDGKVLATTLGDDAKQTAYPEIVHRAAELGLPQSMIEAGGITYDLVTVPLMAPLPIAWVSMGFTIDNGFANELHEITDLEVTLLSRRDGVTTMLGTSLSDLPPGEIAAAFANHGRHQVGPSTVELGGHDYLVLRQPFGGPDSNITVLLKKSLYAAMAPYRTLRIATIVLGSIALGFAIFGAFVLAGAITRPVRQLAQAARRITEGDYSRPVEIRSHDELGELAVAFNTMQSGIAEREKRITHQALYDALTGLPNRIRALELLGASIARADKLHQPVSLLLIDLNSLGAVGASLGHEFGDALIRQAAERLRANLEEGQTLARLGGDEFLILMDDIDVDGARAAALDLLKLLEVGLTLQDANIRLDACIGVCTFPRHGREPDQLLQRAAVAKHDGKEAGEKLRVYEDGTEQKHMRQLALLGDLRRAAHGNELVLYLQPKIDLKTKKICGAEALVRWDHPTMGFLPPQEFIPVAEKSGNISLVTHWIIKAAIRECRRWQDEGLTLSISINLSGHDLHDQDLPYFILETLREHDLDPGYLILEITEEVLVRDFDRATLVLEHLRDMGARISIDDFGTGYSSLAQIKLLPIDELKIDRSFVLNLPDNRQDLAIVSATIELAHNLGLELVAEGVETRVAMDWLAEQGCEHAQGYLISRPMPAEVFSQWAANFDGEVATQVIAFSPRKTSA